MSYNTQNPSLFTSTPQVAIQQQVAFLKLESNAFLQLLATVSFPLPFEAQLFFAVHLSPPLDPRYPNLRAGRCEKAR